MTTFEEKGEPKTTTKQQPSNTAFEAEWLSKQQPKCDGKNEQRQRKMKQYFRTQKQEIIGQGH